MPLTFTLGLLSVIKLPFCDFTSTTTFLLASTEKSDSQGTKYVSSAITSNLIFPLVFSSNSPLNFFTGT